MAKSNAVKSSQATVDSELAQPPAPVPTSAPARFQMVAIASLSPSPLNPRKTFDQAKHLELTASVKVKGVLEPLLVRPLLAGFSVVAGERRYRAAVAAKLTEVPCLVKDMTDSEALEVGLLENVCREDISALDEGDAFRMLVKDYGRTVEQLVEQTGKSRTIVFARMKLAGLAGVPRQWLEQGKLSASVAELIARLPTEAMQEAAFEKLKKNIHYRHANPDDREDISRFPLRDAKDLLDEDFRLVLKKAPFDVKAEQLVAGVGACGVCPKRTAADHALFPGVKDDTCLDAACWSAKASAATRLLKKEVLEHGKELVRINKLSDQYSPGKLAKPVAEKFSKPGEKLDGKHTWKDLLGGETPTVVALDKENKTHNLVDKKKAMELLEAKDPKKALALKKAMEEPKKDDWEARQAVQLKKRQAENAAHKVLRHKALAGVTKLDQAIELLLASWTRDWQWGQALLEVGVPKGTKPEKLKPAQRVAILVARALSPQNGETPALDVAARLVKLDVKKLTKAALAAEPGTCFACGCTKEKQCRKNGVLCVDAWVDAPEGTLCTACGGEAGKKPGEG